MNENLVATWDTAEVETPTVSFENNYEGPVQEKPEESNPEKPEDPKKDQGAIAPETGDESNLWQWVMLLSISGLALSVSLKKKL